MYVFYKFVLRSALLACRLYGAPFHRCRGGPMKTYVRLLLGLLLAVPVFSDAADTCRNRGELDPTYCDENRDFVADAPKNSAQYRNPDTLTFMYTPTQDAAVVEKQVQPFTQHL